MRRSSMGYRFGWIKILFILVVFCSPQLLYSQQKTSVKINIDQQININFRIGIAGQFLLFHAKDDRVVDYYHSEIHMNQTYSMMGLSPEIAIEVSKFFSLTYAPTFRYGYLREISFDQKIKTFYHDHHWAIFNRLNVHNQLGLGWSILNTGKGFSGTLIEVYEDGNVSQDDYMDLQFMAFALIYKRSLQFEQLDYELKALIVPNAGISFIPAVKRSFIFGFALRYRLQKKINPKQPVLY
ncbi:MAG: hypothetical protein ACKVJ9_02175 [Cytophagales bacterium]|jgi:hypothetical protein